MNPTIFSELLTDIADEYIVSAARPHRKPARWYSLSAIAACIVLLISAAIYPKLRVQKPPIVMPPAVTNETTTETTVLSAVPPSTDQPAAQTGITQTKAKTTAHTAISATVTVYTTAVTAQESEKTEIPEITEVPQITEHLTTNAPVSGTTNQSVTAATTAAVTRIETKIPVDVPVEETYTEMITTAETTVVTQQLMFLRRNVPVLNEPVIESTETISYETNCRFRQCDDAEMSDLKDKIVDDIDEYDVWEVTFEGNAANAVLTQVFYHNGQCTFSLNCQSAESAHILRHFYVPVLKKLHLRPENCHADFQWLEQLNDSSVPAHMEMFPDWTTNNIWLIIIIE